MRTSAARSLLRQGSARPKRISPAIDVDYATTQQRSLATVLATVLPSSQRHRRSRTLVFVTSSQPPPPPPPPLPSLPHRPSRCFHACSPVSSRGSSISWDKKTKKEYRQSTKDRRKSGEQQRPSEASREDDVASQFNHPQPSPDEPLDFADVESRLGRHREYFTDVLQKLRGGGRFNPDVIGRLRVFVADEDAKRESDGDRKGETFPLRELAQVLPRGGRSVSLLVHESAYVKPIMSAVQASPEFNQQPQRDPENELELTLRVERESREDLARRTKAACHDWRDRVRGVRQRRDKLHATWKKDRAILPDLQRKADKELEKIVKAAVTEIDGLEKEALKTAEGK